MTQRCFWLGTGVVLRPMGPKITILSGAAREVQPTVRDANIFTSRYPMADAGLACC